MRKFGILFLAMIVILFFFAGFYLFIVPSNKEATDKYGLLILQQLQTAIQGKMDADIAEYSAYLEHYYFKNKGDLGSLGRRLKRQGVDSLYEGGAKGSAAGKGNDPTDTAEPKTTKQRSTASKNTTPRGRKAPGSFLPGDTRVMISTDTEKVIGGLMGIRLGRVVYEFDYGSRSIELAIPVSRLMGDLDRSFPADFFSAFLFLKSDTAMTTTLYKSDRVPVGLQIRTDSLLKNSKGGFYPGITDLNTGSSEYKLFYIPVIRDDQQFVLCGVKDAGEYNQALHEVPAQFLYPLVIAIILLLIALPLVKLYTIGPTEAIRIKDLIATAFSLLGGSMMITLIIIQVILLKDGEARQQIGLTRLSGQLTAAFKSELKQAFTQLQTLDQRRALSPDHWIAPPAPANPPGPAARNKPRERAIGTDVSDSLITFLGTATRSSANPATQPYLNFDRISWVTDKGLQIAGGSPDTTSPSLFIDVSERQYFTDFANNNCYRLPGLDTALVSVQPVLSWSDGSFRTMLARRSACPDAFLVTMSADLYSVDRTVIPSGYGFCIINDSGLVQMHSEPSRNLVENFLQQSADASQLKAAMRGRQELYLQQTELYGKEYGLLLEPIKYLPYHLLVFYDRGYILPVNLRILVYSVMGCTLTLLVCVLLIFLIRALLYRRLRRWNPRPILFDGLDFLQAVIPARRHLTIYSRAALILECYVVVLLLFAIAGNPYSLVLNNIVLYALYATPVIVAASLLLSTGWPAANARGNYLFNYSLVIMALVVSLGAVPAALYTWHAQNQELLQAVKRDQLLKAVTLESRRDEEYQPLAHFPPGLSPFTQYRYRQYRTGLYSISHDSLSLTDDFAKVALTFDEQYFNTVDRWGDIDYDPQFIPILRNQSADKTWVWTSIESDSILPFEYTLNPDVYDTAVGRDGRTATLSPPHRLLIRSVLPRRYPYLGTIRNTILLILVISVLLLGLHRVIRRIATEVFLQKWTRGTADSDEGDHPFLDDYVKKLIPVSSDPGPKEIQLRADKRKEIADAISLQRPSMDKFADMDEEERKVLDTAGDYAEYFHWIFQRLQPREQYLVYNLAWTGFLNYKNVQEINRLLKVKVLVRDHGRIRLFCPAFRAYIRLNITAGMLKGLERKSDWQRFRIPFYVLLAVAAAFLFLTQQAAWQRMVALLTALSSTLATVRGLLRGEGETKADVAIDINEPRDTAT